ncbi:uncharacterized protein JN550_002647 [Neoarthrinium moseri]|uniref:uncharacterized protein n=1 Tax=Neoarthrinium moseri TaxID=1658444 RepID=UPI001FDE4EE8|nr:uncharacterized protein JN550_002647 [Neoarthrinium moseri]KAI1874068.1 hypothetical protein JN550_002647 [Neoarthrinium moseri]
MSTTIAEHVLSCFESFKSIRAAEHSTKSECKIRDQLPRFKVWTGNIGAHQRGKSSLDYRLRDASHLTSQVKNLLQDLKSSLDNACSILDGSKLPWDEELSEDDDDDDDDDDYTKAPEDDNIGFTTEMDQISADVAEVINCLMNLSVSIRNPAPHDRFRGSIKTDASFYEPSDIAHVKAKYANADPKLVTLLGKANTRRRQYFKYRESHHQKLSRNLDLDYDAHKSRSEQQSTIASSIPAAIKAEPLHLADTVDADELSDSGFTQTSYASSAQTSDRPRLPALPSHSADGPFQCPFCFMMITVTTSYAWRKHIFADLRPYSCVAVDCPIAGAEFGRRHKWMEHMLQNHWREWHCTFCVHEPFPSTTSLQNHLRFEHAKEVPKSDVKSATILCERLKAFDCDTKCPLCHILLDSLKKYRHHVGQHLEDIALFVLPQVPAEDIISDDGGSRSGSGLGSSYMRSEYEDLVSDQEDVRQKERISHDGGFKAERFKKDEVADAVIAAEPNAILLGRENDTPFTTLGTFEDFAALEGSGMADASQTTPKQAAERDIDDWMSLAATFEESSELEKKWDVDSLLLQRRRAVYEGHIPGLIAKYGSMEDIPFHIFEKFRAFCHRRAEEQAQKILQSQERARLEKDFAAFWARIKAHPDTYVMTHEEFDRFSNLLSQFGDSKTVSAAMDRYHQSLNSKRPDLQGSASGPIVRVEQNESEPEPSAALPSATMWLRQPTLPSEDGFTEIERDQSPEKHGGTTAWDQYHANLQLFGLKPDQYNETSPSFRVGEPGNDVPQSSAPSDPFNMFKLVDNIGAPEVPESDPKIADRPSDATSKSEYEPFEPATFGDGSNMAASSLIQGHQTDKQPRMLTTKEDANYQCEVNGCGKHFSKSYDYKAHLETHDENREYRFLCLIPGCSEKCDFCGRLFARKDTLRRHMEDGCSERFDIGAPDRRSRGYDTSAYSSLQMTAQAEDVQPADERKINDGAS